ncbi:MAG: prepilin peptidase [Myxococcales bacterium]|nr:prepilin peptidase [Myxococcales bacterium]
MALALTVGLAAALWDVRTRTIPNALTYSAVLVGLAIGLWPDVGPSVSASLLGLAIGFLPALLLFSMGSVGGGDVKLLAALGALLGSPRIVEVLLLSLVAGGALALCLVVWRGRLSALLREAWLWLAHAGRIRSEDPAADLRFPFALAAFFGVVWAWAAPHSGWSVSL